MLLYILIQRFSEGLLYLCLIFIKEFPKERWFTRPIYCNKNDTSANATVERTKTIFGFVSVYM